MLNTMPRHKPPASSARIASAATLAVALSLAAFGASGQLGRGETEAAARLQMRNGDYAAASASYGQLLVIAEMDRNDPVRGEWSEQQGIAYYAMGQLAQARQSLEFGMRIRSLFNTSTHPAAAVPLSYLVAIAKRQGTADLVASCDALERLAPRAPVVASNLANDVRDACPRVTLRTLDRPGERAGNWEQARTLATSLGLQDSSARRQLVEKATYLTNQYLGSQSPLQLSPSWEVPPDALRASAVAVFLVSQHQAAGSGVFVPSKVAHGIVVEARFLDNLQTAPPMALNGLQIPLEDMHLLAAVLLHEAGHIAANDQFRYAEMLCQQKQAAERNADEFAAVALHLAASGDRGEPAKILAVRTVQNLIVYNWTFTVNRALREVFPKSLSEQDYRKVISAAYCEGGPTHAAPELRLLRILRTILSDKYIEAFGEDKLKPLVEDLLKTSEEFATCAC